MASKLAAAKIAAWSGVRVVIAAAARPGRARRRRGRRARRRDRGRAPSRSGCPARKLWIAFAVGSSGTVVVDEGARAALLERGVSLLPAGVVAVHGPFDADAAVEMAGPDGRVFAKGLTRHPAHRVKELAGRRTSDLPDDVVHEVVHRDDLVAPAVTGTPGPAVGSRGRPPRSLVGLLTGCAVVSAMVDTQQAPARRRLPIGERPFQLRQLVNTVDVGVKVGGAGQRHRPPRRGHDRVAAPAPAFRTPQSDGARHQRRGRRWRPIRSLRLQQMFGPRNPSWDKTSISRSAEHLGLAVLGGVGVVVALVVVVAVVITRRNAPPAAVGAARVARAPGAPLVAAAARPTRTGLATRAAVAGAAATRTAAAGPAPAWAARPGRLRDDPGRRPIPRRATPRGGPSPPPN